MAEKSVLMDVFCLHCREETPHMVAYGQKYLKEMRCEVCGTVIRVDRKRMLELYAHDMVDRILSKPLRMKKELAAKSLSEFTMSLPVRVALKPVKVAKELAGLVTKGDWPTPVPEDDKRD